MQANIEILQALFQQPEFVERTAKIQGERVFRVEIGGHRHYRKESGRTYKSLTTFLDAVMPANKFLQTWKENMVAEFGSREKMNEFVNNTADYGTALHIAVAEFCRKAGVDWGEFEQWSFQYLSELGFERKTFAAAHSELTRDFAAMIQWIHDYRVEVIAVELPVFISDGVATLVDLVVEMDAKNYDKTPIEKRERHKAIVNLKSGKKGFFESHIFQLEGERRMFNQTFGELAGYKIEQVYNLAPNNWRDNPTYKLKNQTADADAIQEQFDLFLKIGKQRGILDIPVMKYPVFLGKTAYGENPTDAMTLYGYDDYSLLKIASHANSQENK